MAAMSNYLENKLIDHLFRGYSYMTPSTMYVGLFTSNPSDSGGGVEVSGNNYARVGIGANEIHFTATDGTVTNQASTGTSGTTKNADALTFPTPSASWGTITGFGMFDSVINGNLLFYGALSIPKVINQDDVISFPALSLSIQLDN